MITEKVRVGLFREEREMIKEEFFVDSVKLAAASSELAKKETNDCVVRAFKTGAAGPTVLGDILGVMGYMVNYNRNIANGMTQADALEAFNNYINGTLIFSTKSLIERHILWFRFPNKTFFYMIFYRHI